MVQPHVIHLDKLSKVYGQVHALVNVDLTVRQGELFGFLGPNGAGKTTAIRVITGLVKPTSGCARIFGIDAWKDSLSIKRRLGFVPDFPALYEGMTGADFLDYMGCLNGTSTLQRRTQLCDAMQMSQSDLRRRIKGYSRGTRQKLAIVQALQHKPDLLVLDEPSEGLDPLMQQAFFGLVREFQSQGGTVFMSSHILPEVEALCQRVAMIRSGKLLVVDEVAELKRRQVRYIEVEFRGHPPPAVEATGVKVLSSNGRRWQLAIHGDINSVIREIAQYDLADLIIESPHLDDAFMEYYRRGSS